VTRALAIGWLTALWLVLWRDVSAANVLSGVAVVLVVLAVFPPRGVAAGHTLRPLHVLVFVGYFLWKLLVAGLVVAREVVTPRDSIRSGIVAVPLPETSDLIVTIAANSDSLTPGTLTLEVRRDPPTLSLPVLHLHDLETVRKDIAKLQRLVLNAIGTREVLERVDAQPPPGEDRNP